MTAPGNETVAQPPSVGAAKPPPAVSIAGLHKRFGRKEVLRGLDLSVPAGSIYAFIGRNGAGKSTTIRAMLGLLPFDGGTCRVLGLDPAREAVAVRRRVGYMAENQTMYGWMTVRQIIDWVGRFYPTWNRGLAEQLRGKFQLDPSAKVGELSKGQTSKLALLVALAHEPKLVVLDDPTLGLDPIARKDFLRDVIGELQERNITVFFSSHLLYEIEPICDYIGIIDDGRMVRSGPTDALREQVKRIVVTADGTPTNVAVPGLLDVDVQGRMAAIVTEDCDGARTALAAAGLEHAEVEELSLDEVFEAYVIGRREGGRFTSARRAEVATS